MMQLPLEDIIEAIEIVAEINPSQEAKDQEALWEFLAE